jgi:hypothetical protein
MLVNAFPTCEFCPDEATRWRYRTAPEWGFDHTGATPEREEAAYTKWETEGVPDGVYGTCDEHFRARRDENGVISIPQIGKRTREPKARKVVRNRELLISNLGGKCMGLPCDRSCFAQDRVGPFGSSGAGKGRPVVRLVGCES